MNAKPEDVNKDIDYVVMTISMPKEMKKTIKMYAVENDMNVSQVIRKILYEKGPEYGLLENKE